MTLKCQQLGSAVSGTLFLGVALLAAVSITATQAVAKPVIVMSQQGNVRSVTLTAPPTKGPGWVGNYTSDVSGLGGIFFHYECPRAAPIPLSGAFETNAAGQPGLQLVGNGRRPDVPKEWQWTINWNGTAAAGSSITFNVYCTTKQ